MAKNVQARVAGAFETTANKTAAEHSTAPPLLPLPLLVTGVAGVAGYNALAYFQAKYPGQVFGIRQADNLALEGPGIQACNAEDLPSLQALFAKHQFRSVLDCAGNCALKVCELAPETAWRINYTGVYNLLQCVREAGARWLHLSIDLVFSGEDAAPWSNGGQGLATAVRPRQFRYQEADLPDPVTVYGKSMAAAEHLILESHPQACILRISLPMGVSFNGHAGAIDWIQARFQGNRPATLYWDEIRTPTYTDCLNLVCEQVLERGLTGLFHAGGPCALSLFEIAQIVNRLGGYPPELLQGIPRRQAGPLPPRAGNVAMHSDRLLQMLAGVAFDPWPWDPAWLPTHPEWHYERTAAIPGSPEFLSEVLYANPARRHLVRPQTLPGFPQPRQRLAPSLGPCLD